MGGFALKIFFFLWSLTPTLRAKSLSALAKFVYTHKAHNTGAKPTTSTMLTTPIKSAQANELTVSIMPTLLSLPVMHTDPACMPILQTKHNPNYSFVVGLKPH